MQRPAASTRWRWSAPLGAAALAGAAVLADVGFDPIHRHVPLCAFHAVTGWSCPLCGGLRAVDSLAHLQLTAAAQANVLVVLALPLAVLWWLGWSARSRAGRPRRALPHGWWIAVLVLAVGFTIVRNLPFSGGLRPA